MTAEERSMLDDLLAKEEGLSGWEMDFIESLDRLPESQSLTEKQHDKLTDIWEKKS